MTRFYCLLLALPGRLALLIVTIALVVSPLATGADDSGVLSWQSPLRQQHPLVGQIHDLRGDQVVTAEQLMLALAAADILLLGEKHDNPDHHHLRLALLQQLLAQGRVEAVVMEMLDTAQQPLINALDVVDRQDAEVLREQLQWQDGWQWSFYEPVVQAVLASGTPALLAGNLSRDEVMDVYNDAAAESDPDLLSEAVRERLLADLDSSHCGLLPASQLPAMLRVQQARDQRMAQRLQQAVGSGQRILLAGNYHLRYDLGVSNYLAADAGEVLSLAFLEVSDERLHVADYFEGADTGSAPWDYVWFTPAITDEDYCDALR